MQWQPYREPLRVTVLRTITIALVAGVLVARFWGNGHLRWPVATLVMLWPSFGGHWVELWFLNWLRPRLSSARVVQVAARVGVWFVGGDDGSSQRTSRPGLAAWRQPPQRILREQEVVAGLSLGMPSPYMSMPTTTASELAKEAAADMAVTWLRVGGSGYGDRRGGGASTSAAVGEYGTGRPSAPFGWSVVDVPNGISESALR
jgi:hypothetical protein